MDNPIKHTNPTDVTATLKFLKWQSLYDIEKPFQMFINIPPEASDQRTTNLVYEDVALPVKDVRNLKLQPTLDQNGFMYCQHHTEFKDFNSREAVDKAYLPEIEQLLRKEVEGVDCVFFFDWRVRCLFLLDDGTS